MAAPPPPTEIDKEERTLAMLCHLGALLTGFIAPLIIWQIKKEDSVFIDDHGKEAVNFQISILLYTLAAAVLVCIFIGIVLLPVVVVINVIFAIIAAVKANNGERYRYPLCIRFIK